MDGILLDCRLNFLIPLGIGAREHLIPAIYTTKEGTQISLIYNNEPIFGETTGGYQSTDDRWLIKALDDISVTLQGTIYLNTPTNVIPAPLEVNVRTSLNHVTNIFSGTITPGVLVSIPINVTIALEADEKLFLEGISGGFLESVIYNKASNLTIKFKNKYKTTYIKAIRGFDLLAALTDKITEGKYEPKSDFLTQLNGYVFTSGDAIRGFPDAVIKTSLSDFFQALTSRFMVGLGIEKDKLAIEKLADYFLNDIAFDLGDVNDLEITVAQDLFINTIKAGYPTIEYEDVNGRFEFNQGQQYTTPITRIKNELNLISPYRADPFGIEFTRINFEGKTTTDSDSDNDTFILNIEESPVTDDNGTYYKLNRPDFLTITGVPSPETVFNVLLTPKRGLLNNGPLIRSTHDHLDDKFIKFQTGDKNVEFSVSAPIGDPVTENADVMIGFLGQRLFLPYYFTFKTQVPVDFQELVKSKSYSQIQFRFKGVNYYGYLWDGGIAPATNDAQQWKLLASTKNDMTKLIKP